MVKKIEKIMMGKGVIFRALNRTFIEELFRKKKKLFFPLEKGEISDIKIERVSPDWAKESCLARYEILFSGQTKKTIRGTAKAKKSIKAVWQIMKYLYYHDFSSGNLQVARPLDYIASINLFLYEEAAGVTLTEIIEKESKTIIGKNLKNVAGWLAKLHNLDFKEKGLPKAVFIGFNGYKNIFYKIGKYIPELKDNLISSNEIKFINQIWKSRKSLIHNDFYPGNSVSNKKIILGIDFDRAGAGPFLMDIAAFYGALEFPKEIWDLRISREQLRHFQDIFLLEYCRLGKLDYSQIKKDLKKFLVKIFLDQIYYYAAFSIRGWNFMDKKTKDSYILKIKTLLLKIKQYLKNL